jgi:hypothetical protein
MELLKELSWLAPDGLYYRVSIAPLERGMRSGKVGVDKRLNALVFEREEDGWIGSAPVLRSLTLRSLLKEELLELWEQATGRG